MEINETSLIFWVALFALFWLGVFVLPMFRLKRAIVQVIGIFRREQSFCFNNSKTENELGLAPPPFWDRFLKLRDSNLSPSRCW